MVIQKVLLLEPYYGGSHKVLMDLLVKELERECVTVGSNQLSPVLITMTGKKWHWRARTSALHFAEIIPRFESHEDGSRVTFKTIFASSVLPLHELVALRSDLRDAKKILYFHENQLLYPVRKVKDRDFQYGYNQILSCMTADVVLFNSEFNKLSFLDSIKKFFKLQPDYRPKNLREQIEPKCKVLYFPMDFSAIPKLSDIRTSISSAGNPIKIVWPHRWEFDKNPELFFRVLYRLVDEGCSNFRLSILGENFQDNPPVFEEAHLKLVKNIDNFGYLSSKTEYYNVLQSSDVVVSTADHEFFGVAIVEAIYCGCYPLCPHKLVYPEILNGNQQLLFHSEEELFNKLRYIISNPEEFRNNIRRQITMNNQGYNTPYMFGGNTGYQGNSCPQVNGAGNYNVRDCMYWPASLADGMGSRPRPNNGSAYSSFSNSGDHFTYPAAAMSGNNGSDPYTFITGVTDGYGTGEPQMRAAPQAPVKAFIATGEGGSGKPIQIPCHMGSGPGQVPQIPNMPPMGYKITVPPVAPTPPVDFEIKQ